MLIKKSVEILQASYLPSTRNFLLQIRIVLDEPVQVLRPRSLLGFHSTRNDPSKIFVRDEGCMSSIRLRRLELGDVVADKNTRQAATPLQSCRTILPQSILVSDIV